MSKGRVLVVDDEPNALRVLSAILGEAGFHVRTASHVAEAKRLLHEDELDAVITDIRMPGEDGRQLFDYIQQEFSQIPVIFLTAFGSVESAVRAMMEGAFYYFVKPPDYAALKGILARAVEQCSLKREVEELKARISAGERRPAFVVGSTSSRKIWENIQIIKDAESSVLIHGETGTGKELVARALHFQGVRKDRPFVAVNCAAIPKELIESELFGYEKGAFTGAASQRIGRVEQAAGGTLFLDEIGELDISVQAKLLRLLQEKEFERLGGNRKVSVDFRLLASTNRHLPDEVAQGTFREDLFYRINVFCIEVPPLRERVSDIPLLVAEFLKEFCARENKLLSLSPAVMQLFEQYPWPGNIRQLRNVLERAVVLSRGREITELELPVEITAHRSATISSLAPVRPLKEAEADLIRDALERCHGNKSQAARLLGMSRKTLYKRIADFNL
ncbi:sigma-54-dependent Fis family transcriptional regulator [Syntrophotalea acetylenivorans]|uniref:Sigma-54-dependent Fis family transcriptional regulator n=1 Tax=Syntrophotalea acetylenivorans TaxID=1842532 RepID=A0A1L3GKH9_9BACT|nr:sigma-54 dependent transcriptional regulator [Syntrophotalea acetylenivorans]APG26429.1 sigma-54-dependent Fis family transcriptional regulator [Syntrophotalea acetylenivorans]